MIKSYKIVIITQIILVLICGFAFRILQDSYESDSISAVLLLLVGALVLISFAISIIVQKLIVSVIHSDSTNTEVRENVLKDKIWKTSFFVILIYGILTFSFAIIAVFSNWDIGFPSYDFVDRILTSFAFVIISSLFIGLLFRVKESVKEIAKFLGFLMILISMVIFSFSLLAACRNVLMFKSYNGNSTLGVFLGFFKSDGPVYYFGITTAAAGNSENELKGDNLGEEEESDNFGFYDMNFSDVDIKDNLELGNSETQNLFKLFLAQYLNLEENQSFNGLRRAIFEGSYYEKFSDINTIDKKIRRNPEKIRETFDSYSPMFYAFLSDKIYFGSNLNLLVDALINSHNDIYGTENPEDSLDKIYKTMIFGEKKEYPDYYYEKLSPYVSENVSNAINKDAKEHLEKDNYVEGYGSKYSTMWIYSFWGRRYKEKNIDVVYEILKEIKEHYEEN